ncbi:3'(2'),5'-bisphosphate nucleotidase [Stella humosa]|uniref:3'(2'),5'-bisphosphate nucleotidase CysQ n=1 Tax=Stella humosa TaxID=94 RepID=A0A3N1M948_9PROT|nr:3'(2'),5'-bisphosphate nucleotidase CysQ [Stella humosa]ROQ00198.1 3'(2'),5'-bisphosphate nucleotidase [Stella humosa]BBK30567.1 3'(2'),5'-bisphosphate nucleotidase CysQ [Stella humosa]
MSAPVAIDGAAFDAAPLLPALRAIAARAGDAILGVYHGDHGVRAKADASPLTIADELADRLIVSALRELTPEIPVVSEETVETSGPAAAGARRFWLVDPLDGTKEFIKRNGEFTVNIALVEDGRPIAGIVHIPVLEELFAGAVGAGATLQRKGGAPEPIHCRPTPPEGAVVMTSRSHADNAELDRFLEGKAVTERRIAGSALKFCRVAEGVADLYPRFGPTSEWDTAAGQAVVEAAGGRMTMLDGTPFRYGKAPGFLNPGFIVYGR